MSDDQELEASAPSAKKGTKGKKGEKPKKGKKKLIMIVFGLLVVGLAAKMTVLKAPAPVPCPPEVLGDVGAGTADITAPAAPGATTPTSTPPKKKGCEPAEAGAVMVLESITLNLADGRYLKLGLALQLTAAADPKAMTDAGGGAKALDAAVEMFGRLAYEDLIDPDARDSAKLELRREIVTRYEGGEVLDVYFTEFVMQ